MRGTDSSPSTGWSPPPRRAPTITAEGLRIGGMTPIEDVLPQVLPSDHLTASGKPVPGLREELRRIPGTRNALAVVAYLVQVVGLFALGIWLSHPLVWALVFVLMARMFALGLILSHEAAHRLLFRRRWLNDAVGRWLCAYPGFSGFELYRRSHFAHHRDEIGPDEPDLLLYANYPISPASLRRKLRRDLTGVSGFKQLRGLTRGLRSRRTRPVAARILATQVLILGVFTAIGRPELYLLCWLAPWMTVWQVNNRLRSIAEHGGMSRSSDRRATTHHVRQGLLPRFFLVPYNVGYHVAHHVDMGVPMWNLPALQHELDAAGYTPESITYPSYRALWRDLVTPTPT